MFSLNHILFVLLCTLCLSHENRALRGLKRLLSERLVSTNCPEIRNKPYKGRLDLVFIYVITYRPESEFNLLALNTALTSHLISALNDCDANGEPIFATEIDPNSHTLVTKQGKYMLCVHQALDTTATSSLVIPYEDGLCISPGSIKVHCAAIRGKVAIYLDGDTTSAKVRSYSPFSLSSTNTTRFSPSDRTKKESTMDKPLNCSSKCVSSRGT